MFLNRNLYVAAKLYSNEELAKSYDKSKITCVEFAGDVSYLASH